MTIDVQGPGGVTVQFPDGTDVATIHSAMTQHFGGPSSAPKDKSGGITAGNLANAALDVPVLGPLARKADAAVRAAIAPAVGTAGGHIEELPGPTFGARYSHALESIEKPLRDFAEEHPIASAGANIAGGLATGSGLLRAGEWAGAKLAAPAIPRAVEAALGIAPRGASIGQQVARSAASGAVIGGFDTAERGKDPVEDFLRGALVGGAIGAGAPAAGRQAAKLWNRAIGVNPELDAQLAGEAAGIHGDLGQAAAAPPPPAAGGPATSRYGTPLGAGGRTNVANPQEAANVITGAVPAFKREADQAWDTQVGRFHSATFNKIEDALDAGLAAGAPVTLSRQATPVARQTYQDLIQTLGPVQPGFPARPPAAPATVAAARDYLVNRLAAATDPRDQRAMQRLLTTFDAYVTDRIAKGTFVGGTPANVGELWRRKLFVAPHAADPASQAIAGLAAPGLAPDVSAETLYGAGSTPVRIAQRVREMFGADSPEFAAVKQGLFTNAVDAAHPAGQAGGIDSLLRGPGRALSQIYLTPGEQAAIQAHGEALRSAAAQRPAPMPTADDLKAAASAAYSHPAVRGLEIKPPAVADKARSIAAELRADGFHPTDQPQTFGALEDLRTLPGRTVTMQDVDLVRRRLNRAGGNFSNPPEQEASRRAISAIDRWLAGGLRSEDVAAGDLGLASRVLNDARANYAAGSRLERLKGAEYRADLMAAGAHSGENVNNAMRQQIRSILLSPAKRRGFSPAEIAAMEQVVKGTATGNAARKVGKLLAGSGLGGLATASAGATAGMAAGGIFGALAGPALAHAGGKVARSIGNAATAREVGNVERLIALRSPLGAAASAAPPGPIVSAARGVDPEGIRRAVILAVRAAAQSPAH